MVLLLSLLFGASVENASFLCMVYNLLSTDNFCLCLGNFVYVRPVFFFALKQLFACMNVLVFVKAMWTKMLDNNNNNIFITHDAINVCEMTMR